MRGHACCGDHLWVQRQEVCNKQMVGSSPQVPHCEAVSWDGRAVAGLIGTDGLALAIKSVGQRVQLLSIAAGGPKLANPLVLVSETDLPVLYGLAPAPD